MTPKIISDEHAIDDENLLSIDLYQEVFKRIKQPAIIFSVKSENSFSIESLNPAFEELFCCTESELFGGDFYKLEDYISEVGTRAIKRNLMKSISQAGEVIFDIVIAPKRKRHYCHIALLPIHNNQKQITHILLVLETQNRLKGIETEFTKNKINSERQIREKTETLILTNKYLRETTKENKDLKQQIFLISKNFISLLKSIPGFLYVVDPETYVILIIREDLSVHLSRDFTDKKCYERIYGFNNPCGFCKGRIENKEMIEGRKYVGVIDKTEKIVTQNIKWIDGSEVWLRRIVD